MCGILAYYSQYKKEFSEERIIKMRDTMQHRGPDDSGIFISSDKKVALASRRLSIIDLSEKGHQPMSNADKSVWIVHNGEIYNFRELRKTLSDFKFKSDTDTEVILHLYEKHGIDCLQYLKGMFAFIILDKRKRRFFFARDHLGIKPLYYYKKEDILIIASEIKAILQSPEVKRETSPAGFLSYLYFGSVSEPYTIIKDIRILPPASYGIFKNGELKIEKYWRINNKSKDKRDERELKRELLERLKKSVKMRLISDVPLGAFLSGGVDSSSVVSLMREVGNNEVKTFSITFRDNPLSEGSFAELIASKYGTKHTEKTITANEVLNEMDKMIGAMDQPTVNGVNTYFVSKFTKESGVTVALSGLGGDELFGGYPSFRWVPSLLRIGNNSLLRNFAKGAKNLLKNKDKKEKLKNYLNGNSSIERAYSTVRGVLMDTHLKWLLEPDCRDFLKNDSSAQSYFHSILNNEEIDKNNITDVVSLLELRGYMRNQLLRDTDFMSMAHSLEVRVPFIDKNLVEFAFSLKPEHKKNKEFLIETMGKRLPKEIWSRPKQGFTFPFDKWIRNELNHWVKESLFSENNEYFDRNGVEELWQGFLDGNIHWSRAWIIAVFNRWKNLRGLGR